MQKALDVIFRRTKPVPTVPSCPDHKVEMRLRGKLGTPARFSAQAQEDYTLIYFCPIDGCNQTEMRNRYRAQIPVPGAPPVRPLFARRKGG